MGNHGSYGPDKRDPVYPAACVIGTVKEQSLENLRNCKLICFKINNIQWNEIFVRVGVAATPITYISVVLQTVFR